MPSALTVGERIILHLAQYSRLQDDFDVPLDVSQDGIAAALRISRAHAAIELKKLKESEEVSERLAHIRRGKTKRKVYFLTPKGEAKATHVREFARNEGIEITPLLDLKKCKAPDLWNALDLQKKKLLAMACVFRKPFKRTALPDTSVSLLPVDNEGMVDMPADLKNSVPTMLTKEELKRFHSLAADYWLSEGDYRERMFHLINAGRLQEVEMLVGSRWQQLISNGDPDLYSIVSRIENPSEKYRGKIHYVQAEIARRAGNHEASLKTARQMESSDDARERFDGLFVDGLLSIDANDHQKAYDTLASARGLLTDGTDARLECEVAEALMNMGRYGEARRLLETVMSRRSGKSDSDSVDRVYYQLGMISFRSGNGFEAVKFFSKSLGLTKMSDKTHLYRALSDAYSLIGMREKAQEFSSKIPATRKWGSS
ncbi:MAG: tetratricopeptide repeat protein [Methanomassiliicoccales archaeon]|nr:tetratricopeptide repeat protein [Methanomassiliicoccales archaeon]